MKESALATKVVKIVAGSTVDDATVSQLRGLLQRAFAAHGDAPSGAALEQLIADANDRPASRLLVRSVVELTKQDATIRAVLDKLVTSATALTDDDTASINGDRSGSLASTALLTNEQLGALDARSVVSVAELLDAIDANPKAAGKLLDLDVAEVKRLRVSLANFVPGDSASDTSERRKRKLVTGLLLD
jgi:hypothetical protein